ncbi:hypothetical protein [uncultured Pseudoteredinibacter sp.]|uniref:hypothetical protein n=1 Tax=uncultured Pseudoteredinibacter sp. TaxID=1641701 RepID=UPI00262A628D|nr:hypothetical protein [uncultured Pseudoteredinibacter sp.]
MANTAKRLMAFAGAIAIIVFSDILIEKYRSLSAKEIKAIISQSFYAIDPATKEKLDYFRKKNENSENSKFENDLLRKWVVSETSDQNLLTASRAAIKAVGSVDQSLLFNPDRLIEISVNNEGDIKKKGVEVSFTKKIYGLYSIMDEDGIVETGRLEKTIELGDIKGLTSKSVWIWAGRETNWTNEDEVILRHDGGIGETRIEENPFRSESTKYSGFISFREWVWFSIGLMLSVIINLSFPKKDHEDTSAC